jgi:hemoglobin
VTEHLRDIETRSDLRAFVDAFYARLLGDPRVAPLFVTLDLDVHLPILVDFWAMVLLGESSYSRNAFQKHVPLAIEDRHFAIWLGHFESSLDAMFSGERAQLAKLRAQGIAAMFRSKLRAMGRLPAGPE